MSSEPTPHPERTEPPSEAASRMRWFTRDAGAPELAELDETEAAELVRRSAAEARDAEPELPEQQPQDDGDDEGDHVVIELDRRWAEPTPTPEEVAELEARREAADAAAEAATERVIAQALATGLTDPDAEPDVRRGWLRRRSGYHSPTAARPAVDATTAAAYAEQAARAEAAAAEAAEAREVAEQAARELAASLEQTRTQLLEETRAREAAEQAASRTAPAPEPEPEPIPEPRSAAAARTGQQIQPADAPDVVELAPRSSSAVITVLLGIGALVTAGVAVYEAYLDRLTSTPGLVACGATLLLVVIVGRARGATARVWLDHGVLHIDEGESHRRFDLTTPNTRIEMVGSPGSRRWKVLILRKGMSPYEIDSSMVDPAEFVEALTPWRPALRKA